MTSLASDVSVQRLMQHTETIAQWVRLSGSDEERHAFAYIRSELESYGYAISQYESDALIGYPGESRLEVLADGVGEIRCNGYSLAPATTPDGIIGDLVYVGAGDASDVAGVDVAGKIVLSDGLATPGKVLIATKAGAIGQIHINDEHIHEMCISPVWGVPVPDTADLLPTLPSVAVTQEDGDRLKELVSRGPVQIRLWTKPETQWRKIPTLIADLTAADSDHFILFSGHVDSWHYGAMDNGTANATQLEVARLLAQHREQLVRGVRLAFWSGHSHGRYAGSTWYADHFWHDLHDHCVCHVNIDSVGGQNAIVLDEAPTMAETRGFARDVLRETVGADLIYKRMSRAGDQSFWGHGIPSIFMSVSEQEREASPAADAMGQLLGSGRRGGGLGWWWHTTEDTVDKIDPQFLLRDARVYADLMWRLGTTALLPFDYGAVATEIEQALEQHEARSEGHFDLSGTIQLARDLRGKLESVQATDVSPEPFNELAMDLGRILIPVNYTRSGPYSHDLALGGDPVPGLADTRVLAAHQPDSDAFRYTAVQLVRERNRVEHALIMATRRVDRFLSAT